MILGEPIRESVTSRGVAVFYKPLAASVCEDLFARLAADEQTDLYYPYPAFSRVGDDEWCSPAEFWCASAERVRELDDDERPLREVVRGLLAGHDLRGKVLFDPACSTGTFLSALKASHPLALTSGQDRSAEMVAHCRERLDEVSCGDASEPLRPEESADFVFCRFLNFHVVSVTAAYAMFRAIALRSRIGGHILVAGHTPVLLASSWFEALGLRVLRRIARWPERDAVMQFYWMRREGALAELPPLSG